MRTMVFKNLEDYKLYIKDNPGTLINGVTQEFLDKYFNSSLEDCEADNATNELCFNCYDCKECYDCSECIGCSYCSECVKCENCSKCFECESCYLCKGSSLKQPSIYKNIITS